MIHKFIKFGIVGFIGMVIDFGITYLFKEKIRINKFVANSLGFSCAATSNFLLNKIFTFHDTNSHYVQQFSIFLFIALVGLLINNIIIYLLNEKVKWNFYAAKLTAIVIVSLWNFVLNYLITFK